MTADEIIEATRQLPFEEQLKIIELILQSLRPHQKEFDPMWAIEARRRVEEIRSGAVEVIPGEEVFAELHRRFGHK